MAKDDATDVVVKALAEIDRAYKNAVAAIDADADPNRAFKLATELTEGLRERTYESADVRIRAITKIHETEKMSLAELADSIGVSKARAAQLVRAAKSTDTAAKIKES